MAGAFAQGFSAQEISTGIQLCGLEPDLELSDQVHEMGQVAAKALNERKP